MLHKQIGNWLFDDIACGGLCGAGFDIAGGGFGIAGGGLCGGGFDAAGCGLYEPFASNYSYSNHSYSNHTSILVTLRGMFLYIN